ncbi:hypothetical protein ACOSQ3_032338 [Xanthoceras sorbifolium]
MVSCLEYVRSNKTYNLLNGLNASHKQSSEANFVKLERLFTMERFLFTKLSMLIVIALVLQMHGYKGCLEKERIALLEIKELFLNSSVGVDYDRVNSKLGSWVDDRVSDCCNWNRVECNTTTSRVINLSLFEILDYSSLSLSPILNFSMFQPFEELQSLNLSWNYFKGCVNSRAHQESLKQLKILDLGYNNFNSSILPYLTTLTSLRTLILQRNYLEDFNTKQGSGLTNLKNLEFLDLSSNGISGTLQELGLANLRNLEVLDLSFNQINGTLQELGICKLKNLIELDLAWNNFEGHLPICLNNLTNLRALDLSFNQLNGNISFVIQNLATSLEYLSLRDNNFEGLFSFSYLANLSKLEIFGLSTRNSTLQVLETENQPPNQLKALYLRNCNLRAIPSFVMHQHSLQFIDLSHNKLVGMFPTWLLHNNTRLQGMNLMNNSFTGILQLPNSTHDLLLLKISTNNMKGQLPKNMGMILLRLSYLDLSKNSFEGHIPSSMGEMKGLTKLDLSSNNFLGELPKSFISGCFSLAFLRLSNNNFHGEIFSEFMNMTQLKWLFLDNNKFGGNIQNGLSKAVLLAVLDLSNNSFSGQIPHWIGNFSNLLALSMSNNLLEGGVPVQLSNIKGLQILHISENRLSGSIASSTNLSSVRHLYMQKNALSGSIPNAFFRSSALFLLDLRDNEFSGNIPNQIDDGLSNLNFLLLAGNHLEGHIPHELCRLKNVSILDLSRNKLNGTIPSCFTNLSLWSVESGKLNSPPEMFYMWPETCFPIASHNFTLNIFMDIYSVQGYEKLEVEFVTKNRHESYEGIILRYMTGIDLSSNKLTGDVPSEFGSLQNIHAVNLSHNSLSGSIPESFSHLKNIESLDLSHNKLCGRIPPQLTELNSLGTFIVTFNNLSGPVPVKGQFGTFDEKNYGGNPGLCGSQIKRNCEPTAPPASPSGAEEEDDESSIDMVSFYWSLFASSVTTILALVLILWLNSDWHRQWFYFIDECIITCHCWILRYVFRRYR